MNHIPYRAMREATGLSLRELSRRTGWVEDGPSASTAINPGRLSLIERGLPATEAEAAILKRLLGEILTGAA
jgi:transcriptional regulator with XRE-family HTH domain